MDAAELPAYLPDDKRMTGHYSRRGYLLGTTPFVAGAVAGCLTDDSTTSESLPYIDVSNMSTSSVAVSIEAHAAETDRELVSETVRTEPKGVETQYMLDMDIEKRTEILVTGEIEADSDSATHHAYPTGHNPFSVSITDGPAVDVGYTEV
ncbi:hypothetical protein C479_15217 [Halovivax asiaticus JCM 14624]|uniref:Uncharacterized protein n=1 Tax=Halovivax asiaticus JCM 14624 TaxID=1227490 RepID=M0B8L4_9EURY|nr:hypothetical protein [Halovivax asiaticus]ELZ07145.1 hypothetical protein C479_15217 [Halovivax asiaticus JCM 14624]